MTTRRYDIIQAHAARLITQAGGVAHIDSLAPDARRYALVSLCKQLQADQRIVRDTARQHIARACRKARHPDYTPPQWGGDRSAGPATHTEPVRGMPGIDPANQPTQKDKKNE